MPFIRLFHRARPRLSFADSYMRIYAAVKWRKFPPQHVSGQLPRAPPRFPPIAATYGALGQILTVVTFSSSVPRRTVLAPEFNSKSPILIGGG